MLTAKQRELLLFIDQRLKQDGISPSFDEMREALELKSKSGVHRLISALEERGFIRRLPNRARALEVVKLPEGKSRAVADPQGRGFFVVKVTKITPGNALLQPGLISRMQNELQEALSQDYAQEFVAAVRADVKAKRNEDAIKAEKARITQSGG